MTHEKMFHMLDEARRLALETTMERLEHVVKRIHGDNTSVQSSLRYVFDPFEYFSYNYVKYENTTG